MSQPYRRIYPNDERVLFDGGKNNKFSRSIIEDNESPDCLNVVFTDGAVGTRQGFDNLNTTSIGSFAADGLYTRHQSNGAQTMVVFGGGTMWTLGSNTFVTVGSAQSVFTAGNRVGTAEFQDYMFIGNGGAVPYKYDGSVFSRHGVYPPTTAAAVATAATGNALTGAYRYKTVFVNSALVESDAGPTTATMTAAGENIAVTTIPVAPTSWGVNARRLYRTANGGSTYKRLVTISDNTTTTYDDAILDAALGADAPTDNGVPPLYSVALYHQTRLFVNDPSNPNFVWYSNLNEPFTFASTNFVRIGDDTGDLVKGLAVYDNSILVTCDRSMWLIYMPDTDATNWEPVRVNSPYGSKSPHCHLNISNRILVPAMDNSKFVGFAAVAGTQLQPDVSFLTVSAIGSDLISNRIEPDMFQVNETYVGNISGIVFKNTAWIAVTYGSGNTTNNRVFHYDFSLANVEKTQKGTWVPFTGINATQFTIYNGLLYFVTSGSQSCFVHQLESGSYNDNGSAIDSYFWTKEFSGFKKEVNWTKDWRYANLLVDKAGAYYMDLVYRTDSDTGEGNVVTINLDPGGNQWGSMTWGEDEWGGGVEQADTRVFLGGIRGKRIQFQFSNQNTADQRFKVHGMNMAYNLRGYR